MLGLHVRLVMLAMIMFMGTLLVFRLQHFDEHERRQWFVRDECSAACFIGIHAGKTPVDEAVKLLEASPWITQLDNRTINNVSGFIEWGWTAQKPDWIDGTHTGRIWASQGQVVTVLLYTALNLGDSRLTLGAPNQEVIDRSADRKGIFTLYSEFYGQLGLVVQTLQPCRVLEPLRRPIMLTFISQADPKIFMEQDSLTDLYTICAIPRQ